jgi:hypothetical protein
MRRQYERKIWGAVNDLYNQYRKSADMETSRAAIVESLRVMAGEIEDRSRLPNGEEARPSLIDGADR